MALMVVDHLSLSLAPSPLTSSSIKESQVLLSSSPAQALSPLSPSPLHIAGAASDRLPPPSVLSPAAPKLVEPLPASSERPSPAWTVRCRAKPHRVEPLPRLCLAQARRTVHASPEIAFQDSL
jgi:hypothetical protein